MKIENQVCTIEQAVKLKGLGVKQDSHFFWVDRKEKSKLVYAKSVEFLNSLPIYSAFTTAELGVMIPEWHFTYPRLEGYASYKNEDGDFSVADGTVNGQNYDTEAECRAALVIYLIENNILSVETCNKRLLQ